MRAEKWYFHVLKIILFEPEAHTEDIVQLPTILPHRPTESKDRLNYHGFNSSLMELLLNPCI